MRATRAQQTLAAPCTVSGRGYWTGESITLHFLPAPIDTGVVFVRKDLPGSPRIPAHPEHLVSMPLRTRLSRGSAEVDMVEHVMAALVGCQIDNVIVEVDATEMPGLDGSSLAYALAFERAGTSKQDATRRQLIINRPHTVGTTDQFVRVEPLPETQSATTYEYQLDYGSESVIRPASFEFAVPNSAFSQELAPARTFVTRAEAQTLQSRGIAQHVTDQDLLVFDATGPANNRLRFEDECARHKTLDLVGDLALAGVDLVGRVIARRSGHQLNGEMATYLRELVLESSPSAPLNVCTKTSHFEEPGSDESGTKTDPTELSTVEQTRPHAA